jgi:MFS family permease
MRGLPWSIGASAMNTVFVQFIYFGPVFVLFLSQLNISNGQIGFLLSMFPFMGLVALFIAPAVARFGYKRTFITFWSLRKFVTAFLLLVPLVIAQFGLEAAVLFITIIVIGFGLCRAIAEVGYYPWSQEYVPESIRGKYSATANAVTSLVGIIAVAAASFVLDLSDGLDRFMILFGVGVVFGVAAAWMYTRVPGGASATLTGGHVATRRDMLKAARDSNLLRFLAGIALLTFGTAPLYSFLPIFMQDQVGLSDSNIVLMQNAAQIGGLISVYLLGWSADRYGSKPVLLVGVALKVLLPIGWLLLPRGSELSLPIALSISFFQGVSGIAWAVGSGRLLYVSVVPSEKKSEYMAVYYAAIGIIGGVSQLSGGALLDAFSGISGQLGIFVLDPFTPLMVISVDTRLEKMDPKPGAVRGFRVAENTCRTVVENSLSFDLILH